MCLLNGEKEVDGKMDGFENKAVLEENQLDSLTLAVKLMVSAKRVQKP